MRAQVSARYAIIAIGTAHASAGRRRAASVALSAASPTAARSAIGKSTGST